MTSVSRSGSGCLKFGLSVAAVVLVADQLTKLWATVGLAPYRPLELMSFLDLTLSFNTGAAFSLLADQPGWQRWLFTGLALGVSAFLVGWLARLPRYRRWHAWGIAGILGGALGNVVDRLIHGHVIDFVDFHFAGWHYPAFNVADSAITMGVIALLIGSFREQD